MVNAIQKALSLKHESLRAMFMKRLITPCLSLKKVDSQKLKTNAIHFKKTRKVFRQSDAALL